MSRTLLLMLLVSFALSACSKKEQVQADEQPAETTTATKEPTETASQESEQATTPTVSEEGTIAAPANVEAPPAEATVTDSGLATLVLAPGDGTIHPGPTSVVRVHYTGWTTDGKMFDSSVVRQESISFPLNKVIEGWQEGVMLMVEGETRRLWIPQDLAYKGREGAPKGMLVFDVELIAIESP